MLRPNARIPTTAAATFARAWRRRVLLPLLAAGVAFGLYTAFAATATFTVNSNGDDNDNNPGDGICATASGVCTLRAALREADDTPGFKTINFALGSCSATTTQSGLLATYFNNTALSGAPVLTRYEVPYFDWGSGSPAAAVNSDNFSARWTGTLTIPSSGSYTFQTVSDDGIRLYLNGAAVINDWAVHSSTTDTSASQSYTAGQQVTITLEYYESGGSAVAQLLWKKPGSSSYVAIPIAQLSSPAVGRCVIQPLSALPTITQALSINGNTQSGYSSAPVVEIDGSYAGSNTSGLTLSSVSGVLIRALSVHGFGGVGLDVNNGSANTFTGNYIGVMPDGVTADGNGSDGINLNASPGNVIGGTTATTRNVISGNGNNGLTITNTSTGTTVQGNYIGLNAAGTAALPNGSVGLYTDTTGNTIGGTASGAGNVISGNTFEGLQIYSGSTGNTVQGNIIGLNPAGNAAIGNGGYGIYLRGASNTIGGTSSAARNVISGNSAAGIWGDGGGTGNTIQGNYVGLNAAGSAGLGNGSYGIFLGGGSNTIGSTATGAGNVLSGNSLNGLYIASNSNTVQGNLVGLDATGAFGISNTNSGIGISGGSSNTIGGSASGARNVISGNTSAGFNGIHLRDGSNSNVVKGNYIGTDITGTVAIGNNYAGVRVSGGINNVIGGTAAGEGNLLANNTVGVEINASTAASTGNIISGNSITANSGGGIYLEGALPANDGATTASTGNLTTDTAVFTSASYVGTTLTLAGYVGSAAGQAAFKNNTVEVFVSSSTSGNGQGKTYLGSLSTSTTTGNFSGTLTTSSLPTGSSITATARDSSGNTSIFSAVFLPTYTYSISGTLFEDVNYGGGAGRNKATALAAGGAVRSGVRVELYTVSGTTATNVGNTTTDASGNYSFTGLANGSYMLRVVSSTVTSSRSGATAALIPVLTYRATAASGTAVDVTDEVGGRGPSVTSAYNVTANTGNQTTTTLSYAEGIADITLSNANVASMDFGYNFSTVTNLNNSGQGSLRQVITNANTLGNEALLAQAGRPAGVESVIFMISNGTTGSGGSLGLSGGLRTVNNYFSGGVATLAPTSALPTISGSLLVDAQAQPGWTANPIIELNGTSAGAAVDGLAVSGANSTVRGLVINRYKRHGLYITGNNSTVQGCWIGVNNAGSAGSANSGSGIYTAGTGHTIGGTGSNQGNLISGNTQYGLAMSSDAGSAGNSTVQGNFIGTNAAGSGALGNTLNGIYVLTTGNTIGGSVSGAGNLISGNGANGLQMDVGSNTVQGNSIGTNLAGSGALANGSLGIYLGGGTGNTIGGTSSLQRNVISGNQGGIFVNAGGSHTIQGNYIGLNASGAAAMANTAYFGIELYGSGSNTVGGTATGAGNVISGQSGAGKGGIYIASNSNTIQGNKIGTNAAGALGIANAGPGIAIAVASITNNTIGGTATGAGNTIAYNGQQGVVVSGANSTYNDISRNAIYSNTGIGIDIAAAGRNANNGTRSTSLGNAEIDTPVFTAAALSANTLTVSGYVGSAAGQTTFASSRVEIFKALNDGTGYGQGQTYLGTLTADASGNFTGSLTVTGLANGDLITATAADSSGDTSEFSPNFTVAATSLSGTVFEDVNYGGGAGRSLASSGGAVVSGATVELYSSAGVFISSTSTNASGVYTFNSGITTSTSYYVRVVSSTVSTTRSSVLNPVLGVLTYRTTGASGTAVAVTDFVGGTDPSKVDPGAASSGATFSTSTFVYSAGLSGTAQNVVPVTVATGSVSGLDFGFNFDTVVNTNNSGQGSLRQAITNANLIGNDSSLAQAGRTAAVENLVFMVSNGGTGSGGSLSLTGGLRSTNNYFSSGVATITPTSAMAGVSTAMVIDAQAQPGWTATPVIELNGTSAGTTVSGLTVTGGGSTLRGLAINRYTGNGIDLTTAGSNTIQGCTIGLNPAGTARSANGGIGIYVNAGSTVVGGTSTTARNVIAGNTFENVQFGSSAGSSSLQGNYIGTTASGATGITNGSDGVYVNGASNVSIGGTATGAGNVIAGHAGRGVLIVGSGTGNAVQGNSIFGNGNIGIDLANDGLSANDGAKTTGQPNLKMDYPVFTSASLNGTTLVLTGYVGSAAGQSTFANARVEVFVSDGTNTNGQGKTYLGTVTADASGNFSGSIASVAGVTAGSSKITGTATDGSGNTSEFGPNLVAGYGLSGTVFEDINYGGGAGRSLASSGGAGVAGATVEMYSSSGVWVSSTTTAAGGTYSFNGLTAGNYYLRVVNSTVLSTRSGSTSVALGVMTYRTTATSGAAVAVTDYVGGTDPSKTDPGAASSGAAFSTTTFVYSAGLSGTALSVTPVTVGSSGISGLDFGFNFDTVVNTTDAGQGSLRRAINNSLILGGDSSLAQSGRPAGIENLVFMISNGTTGGGGSLGLSGGLRSSNNYFSGGVATIIPTVALPNVNLPLVIDAQTQPGWTLAPIVQLSGASAGAGVSGLILGTFSSASTVRGLVISGFTAHGIAVTAGSGQVIAGNYLGLTSAGTAAAANGQDGINVTGATGLQIGGTSASQRNVISGNGSNGIALDGSGVSGVVMQGNYIGTNAAGSAAVPNASFGVYLKNAATGNTVGGSVAGAGNVISGNASNGVRVEGPSNTLQGNTIGLNAAANAALANSIGIVVNGVSGTVIGGTSALQANVLSGNTNDGLSLTGSGTTGTTVQGNLIGTNAALATGLGNGRNGIYIQSGAASNTLGGTATGAANTITGNASGVVVTGAGTGNAISGNSIYANATLGIDLLADGITSNDGAKSSAQPNLLMDDPVFTSATVSGTTLTAAGYVGSAASQSTFAGARVEVFVSDVAQTNGSGKTYLGVLTADANGNFSGSLTLPGGVTLTAGTSKITGTATDSGGNTSEFGPNYALGLVITGKVFEDLNYGGGAGRSLAGSGGVGVSGATVELYNASGSYLSATTTDASGVYSFNGLSSSTAYFVRVVNGTVLSTRSGSTAGLLPVMTYRAESASGTAAAVTNEVGGVRPSAVDAAAGASGGALWTSCAAENGTCSFTGTRIVRYGGSGSSASGWVTQVLTGGTACTNAVFTDPIVGTSKSCYLLNSDYQSVSTAFVASGSVANLDFGFNFDTVVNTNDSGQGSLRGAITNANTLGGDSSLAQSGRTAGVENLVFMISNGSAAAGLRSLNNYFSSGVASIAPLSALPTVSSPLVLDAQTQPGWNSGTAAPIVELNGASAGAVSGLTLNAAGATLRGFVINRYSAEGVTSTAAAAGLVIQGNWIGLNAAGTARSANGNSGIWINQSANGHVIGGTSAAQRNVLSGQTLHQGLAILGGSGHTVQGNYIGTDAAGSTVIGNAQDGIYLYGGVSNSTIGGTAAGAGNLIRGNGNGGVTLATGATGNAVRGNSIYGNGTVGIDLNADGATVNDGAKTAGAANLKMDYPVFTSASLNGTTLTVAGYVGSAAGQATFAGATVDVYVSDASSAAGQGQTYLGTLTADASGNFSGSIANVSGVTNGSTKLTGTATDASSNTSEFGSNYTVGLNVGGTVFEDANYGGGAGRSLAGSSGAGVAGASVELYNSGGVYVGSTTTASGGAYSFAGLAPGNYFVRVVSGTVLSQRSGAVAGLLPVLTYRTTATSGSAVAVTDSVGGTNPAVPDSGVAGSGATLSTSTYVYSAGLTGTAHAIAPITVGSASITGLDFGFNFDTVVNTNAGGQGSLAQAITNANALGGDASLAQNGRTAAIENLIFMISNGTSGAGLRGAYNYFSGGVATITPAAALPTISSPLVLDAQTQPGWTANPIVELNGTGAGNNNGLVLSASGSVARGWVVNRWAYAGIRVTANATVQGNWLGTSSSGLAASANGQQGLELNGGSATVGGTGTGQGNVISGNAGAGVWISGGGGHLLQGNLIGLGMDGSTRVANTGFSGIEVYGTGGNTLGGTAAGAGNTISGQTAAGKSGIFVCSSNNTVLGNRIGTNAIGTAAVSNAGAGISVCAGTTGTVIGGTVTGAGNLISGNGSHGIDASSPVSVQGNTIGLKADLSAALANAGTGVWLAAGTSGSAVGGTAAGAPNIIAGNTSRGMVLRNGEKSVSVRRNSIYGNGGIAIDLGDDGVSVNDGAKTAGQANLLIDSPVFTTARATGAKLVVAGYVGSAPNQSAFANVGVEVYASDNDASGYGGGKIYLGTVTADASGNFSGTLTMPVSALAIGTKLTGTASDGSSNTSEFGANFSGLIVDLVVNDNGDAADASVGDGYCATAGGVCTLRAAIAELNAWSGLATPPTIAFAIPGCTAYGAAGCTITPGTALPTLSKTALLDGSTQAGFNTSTYKPIIEISGASAPASTTGLVVSANNATVRGLTINRFPANGLTLSGSGGTLVGLRVGLAANSAAAAANGGVGISITGSGATVGTATAADANTLAGNTGSGLSVAASGASVTGNYFGTDSAGTAGLGNGSHGILVGTSGLSGITITSNTVANNGAAGVAVTAASQVQILANAMSGNGGLGIDLGADGVTLNTGSTSASLPEKGMNFPVITGAGVGSTTMTVYGYIGTNTGQAVFAGARVEFFKAAVDGSGYGEGQVYLGFLTADANGRFSGSVAYPSGQLAVGDVVTATATDGSGNTSEFGPNRTTTTVAALTPGGFNAFDASTAAGALTGTITSKTAGAAASFAVIALDNSGSNLHPGFTGTVTLTWVDARNDSGAVSGSCRSSWTDTVAAGTAVFSNSNRVTVSLTPPPSSTRIMRLRMSYTANGSTTTACSNDAFAALPASLSWINASDADSATAGTTRVLANTGASGGVVHKAGRPFTVRAQALDATGALMTGYDGSPVLAAAGCLLPSGCTAATLTATSVTAVAGTYTHSNVSYAEVGALQVQLTDSSYADVDAPDTAASVRMLTSSLLSVGRFVPDAYTWAVSTSGQLATANSACMASGSGATFIGQAFGWATAPQVTVTAVNAAGATTTRWTGSLMKLASGSGLTETLAASGAGSATFSASYGTVAVSDLGSGQARLTASATDRFLLDLASGTVQDSVTPTWAWTLALSDASEAGVSGNPTLTATANQASVAFNSGSVFHTGRLSLAPAYGDVRTGIHALVQVQRYTAAGWVTLTEDQGCVTVQNQNVAVASPTGVFATLGSCAAPMSGAVTTKGGRAWLNFPGTPAGTPGRLTLRLAGAAASGSSCTAAGANAALVALTPTWLLGGSTGVGPAALGTWGKPQRDATLRRETW